MIGQPLHQDESPSQQRERSGEGEREEMKQEEMKEEEMESVSNHEGSNGTIATPVHVPDVKSSTPPVKEVKGVGRDAENGAAHVKNRHGKAKHLKANEHMATRSRWKLISLDNGVRIFRVRYESERIYEHSRRTVPRCVPCRRSSMHQRSYVRAYCM